jgi:hypothetical protein
MTMMPVRREIGADEIRILKSVAERLKDLEKFRLARRTAAAIAVCMRELEYEAKKAEDRTLPEGSR